MTDQINAQKIDSWFQKWFHNQPGFSDVDLILKRLQDAKQDLLTVFPDTASGVKIALEKVEQDLETAQADLKKAEPA